MSRYAKGIYICAQCGVREAFEGLFWRSTPQALHSIKQRQAAWIAEAKD